VTNNSPVTRVVTLLTSLKDGVEKDGRAEQQSYDKYACWCEDTLKRKAQDIDSAKQEIDRLQTEIEHLEGALGSGAAEIAQLKKDITENIKSAEEAEGVRKKDWEEFDATKSENEQCAGALEAAIKVLSGAGTGKFFLESLQEAQLLSVVDGVRSALSKSGVVSSMPAKDLDMVKRFISQPQAFASQGGFMQTGNNPFGDYAPKSTQIRGILKGMYDSFVADLEKDNADEAEKQKAYSELQATKKDELDRLQASLGKSEQDYADKNKALVSNRQTQKDTQDQLQADEVFFQETKSGCKEKAGQWAERSRLRTEELTGISKAIDILSSDDAKATFGASATNVPKAPSFSQLQMQNRHSKALATVQHLASRFQSQSLSKLAMQLRSGGRFDQVMVSIDKMIALLRAEEADDIAHRDRCQLSQDKNKNDIQDFKHTETKADAKATSLQGVIDQQDKDILSLEGEIQNSQSNLATLLSTRNTAVDLFKKNLKDDADAVELIDQALATLAAFYKRNNKKIALVQNPTYAVDKDAAPSTPWDQEGKDYGGRSSETGGILAILEMIKEDILLEMKVARKDDADAETAYEAERSALQTVLDKQLASKAHANKVKADATSDKTEQNALVSQTQDELKAENALKQNLEVNCQWVASHFDKRREKRKIEMDGLAEAKEFLASGNSLD